MADFGVRFDDYGYWEVQRQGAAHPSSRHVRKSDAVRAAGRYAFGSGGGQVLLLEQDGSLTVLPVREPPPVSWRAAG
ncbi:DUF2188 domain-containing protein [Patulibacter defluvii]|uniref:DUF2188 domain-containing protein n=1 Tax=Patulibacter defluvii TaxID=3095358 RepID=UPI002A754739|nr:DUF2188 domain-containing protein [Patulibacter sp. DM4]